MFDIAKLHKKNRYDLRKSLTVYTGVEGIDYVECKICKKRSLYLDIRRESKRKRYV